MLIRDEIFSWEGWGGKLRLGSGKCRLRMFDLRKGNSKGLSHLRPNIVIVSDIPDSPMSVRSCSGHIASSIARSYNIDPARMMFIEYYESKNYGEQDEHNIPERYEVVEFEWHEGSAIKPKWRPLKPPMLESIQELLS